MLSPYFKNFSTICRVARRDGTIDSDLAEHDTYLTVFQETVNEKLQQMINKNIEEKPEINARNKQIQVRIESHLQFTRVVCG